MTEIVVCDMAGTTVADDGVVEDAFTAAMNAVGISANDPAFDEMIDYVRRTMGESKITVFRALLGSDEHRAQRANEAFERAYAQRVDAGGCVEIPGASEVFRELRACGVRIALTTGFSTTTQRRILTALDWEPLVDLALTPAQAGRGRPSPDLVLTALLRLGGSAVDELVVVGDTASDMRSARAAGAGVVAGVLTGAHDHAQLTAAGATRVLGSVRELPELLGCAE